MKLSFNGDELKVFSSSPEIGEFEEIIMVSTKESHSDQFELSFDVKFMLEAISSMTSDNVTMKFAGELSPCEIVGEENERAIVLPVRIR